MAGTPPPRLFTLAEARSLLPALSPLLQELQAKLGELERKHDELESVAGGGVQGNGHRYRQEARAQEVQDEVDRLTRELQEGVHAVERHGCELKDIREGLLDFRSVREGRVVYLCWRLGEPDISHWHDLQTGFAGRQPL